jgi:hypothetical protein
MRCCYGPHAEEPIEPGETEPVDGTFCCRHDPGERYGVGTCETTKLHNLFFDVACCLRVF